MTSSAHRPDSEWRAALADIAPAMVASMPFAALCGALAVAKGLSPAEVFAMSLIVFAGGAQFAAIEIWTTPVPVFALVVSTLLINTRHILMGVSLRPKLHALSAVQRVLGCFTLADENWALAERRATVRVISPTYFLVMGTAFWASWVVWSLAGALLGPVLGDPRRLGADFAFTAIFVALIVSLRTGSAERCRRRGQRRDGGARPRADRVSVARPVGRAGGNRGGGDAPQGHARGAMSLDGTTLLTIVLMGLATYLTRIAGLFIAGRFRLEGQARAAFDAIPISVLTAVIAPTLLTSSLAESFAGVITILAAFRLPLLGTVTVGVTAVVLLRLALG